MSLGNSSVVVIGGSSGIGFAVAHRALEEGARVVIGSSDAAKLSSAVERLGPGVSGHVVDVRDESSVGEFFRLAESFDHLAFTAGDWRTIRVPNPVAELDVAAAQAMFGVRFWGALLAIKHGLSQIAPDGSITLTGGMVAHRPRKGAPLNSAMAGAIEHLTRGLAVDLAPVRINAVCPGIVLTEVWESVPEDQREARLRQMTGRQPLPRAGDPAEVAEAYLYLMKGAFSTGQVLIADGGMSLV